MKITIGSSMISIGPRSGNTKSTVPRLNQMYGIGSIQGN